MSRKAFLQTVADLLTAGRAGISVVLVFCALFLPQYFSPEAAVGGLLLGWTTDVLDGYLARRSGTAGTTWWGRHDLLADLMLVTALAVLLILAGVIPASYLLAITAGAVLVYLMTRQPAVIQLLMGIIDGLFIFFVFRVRPQLGRLIIGWIMAVAVLDWPRTRGQVGGFLQGAGKIVNSFRGSSS